MIVQCTAKNSIDETKANKGKTIQTLSNLTESKRFKSPFKYIIPKANKSPTISRKTSNTDNIALLKPKNDELKGQNSITPSTNKSPKVKCCNTATRYGTAFQRKTTKTGTNNATQKNIE